MIGRRILNYTIESVIGKGGMGEVYLATHETIGRKVAIKSLLPNLIGHSDIRQRFINEAKVMSQLSHTNIVGLLDYHEEPDGLYLIMDYVDGTPLDELIKNVTGPIGGETCVSYVRQILEAFNYAHSRGMVHRDIKPSNVMITRDGQVKVLDFGIAKILDSGTSSLTKTGAQMGTVYYMSPEQVEGKEADVRSDIYSLGVTIYQIATGSNPYHGITTEYEIYSKIIKDELPDPKTVYPGVSDSIAALILKATAKSPADRFQSCKEMLNALQSGEVVNVPKPKAKKVNVASKVGGSGKKRIALVAAALAVIGLGIYAYTAGLFKFGKQDEAITMFPVMVSEKISYFDNQGKEVIAAQFSDGTLFYEGIAVVNTGGDDPKYGYIDQTGKYIINPQFKEATIFDNGMAWVARENGKITAINTSGTELFSVDASFVEKYSEGLALFRPNYPEKGTYDLKYGYYDEDGEIKIPAKFDFAATFKNGRARTAKIETDENGIQTYKWSFIDQSGTVQSDYYDGASDFEGDYAVVRKEGKAGIINKSGKLIVPIMYDDLMIDKDWFIYMSSDSKYGWLDNEGSIIINAQFDMCQPFGGSDLAPVQMSELWGYIARDGKITINPQFDGAASFKGDITAVYQGEKYGFIDKEGKYVIAPNLEDLSADLLAEIDQSGVMSIGYRSNRWAYNHHFDAAALATSIDLENPGGLNPRTTTFAFVKEDLGMSNGEFSTNEQCYPTGEYYDWGGSSHSTSLYYCGDPWSQYTYQEDITYYGYYFGSIPRTASSFNDNQLAYLNYDIVISGDYEKNADNLIAELNRRLTSEGYTNLTSNSYSKNGLNVNFGKTGESKDKRFFISVWAPNG